MVPTFSGSFFLLFLFVVDSNSVTFESFRINKIEQLSMKERDRAKLLAAKVSLMDFYEK